MSIKQKPSGMGLILHTFLKIGEAIKFWVSSLFIFFKINTPWCLFVFSSVLSSQQPYQVGWAEDTQLAEETIILSWSRQEEGH